jgi:PKD repeat protein
LIVNTQPNPLHGTRKFVGNVGNVTTYTDYGYPDDGTIYHWWVWGLNDVGQSPWPDVSANGRLFIDEPDVEHSSLPFYTGNYTGSIGYEGIPLTLYAGNSTDSDGNALQFRWDFDNDGVYDTEWSGSANVSHAWDDDYSGAVELEVTDGQLTSTKSSWVIALNLIPVVGQVSALIEPVQVNTPVHATGNFTDPGFTDTHTAEWDWDDGTTSAGTVTETDGVGVVTDSHTYSNPGVYEVRLTVTDDDGDSASSVSQYVVVYDPGAGFVTGGGWIDSPQGAYAPDPSLTGKASFGFVSKYKKGATVPTGQTEFQFRVANLNFHSYSYDWLVIAGHKAMYKGTGTINGEGNYGFMLSAIDESLTTSTDVDMFRIKIWDKDNDGTIIYDNQIGDDDDADPTTEISGGSILIQKK